MPDLNIESARWCQTNEFFQSMVSGSAPMAYVVEFQKGQWSCTCPAFMFSKGKHCKHIDLVEKERCGYGWEAAAGSPIEMGDTCPECSGPTRAMSYAV